MSGAVTVPAGSGHLTVGTFQSAGVLADAQAMAATIDADRRLERRRRPIIRRSKKYLPTTTTRPLGWRLKGYAIIVDLDESAPPALGG